MKASKSGCRKFFIDNLKGQGDLEALRLSPYHPEFNPGKMI